MRALLTPPPTHHPTPTPLSISFRVSLVVQPEKQKGQHKPRETITITFAPNRRRTSIFHVQVLVEIASRSIKAVTIRSNITTPRTIPRSLFSRNFSTKMDGKLICWPAQSLEDGLSTGAWCQKAKDSGRIPCPESWKPESFCQRAGAERDGLESGGAGDGRVTRKRIDRENWRRNVLREKQKQHTHTQITGVRNREGGG